DATKSKKVATPKKKDATKKRSGNPNPKNQFTKRNTAAVKHGFFSKYLPQDTLDIMEEIQEMSPADMIWDQIMIQYTAIIRAQRIMFVEDKDEIVKEVKKEKTMSSDNMDVDETEWEIQFAWDRHASFLNAQSRAMSELRNLIKQFNEMATDDDERRLKLQLMQANIKKAEAEADRISKENTDDELEDIIIVDEWSNDDE